MFYHGWVLAMEMILSLVKEGGISTRGYNSIKLSYTILLEVANSPSFVWQRLVEPVKIEWWVVVNFSACCNMPNLCRDLATCGKMKGMLSIKLDSCECNIQLLYVSGISFVMVVHSRISYNVYWGSTVKSQFCFYEGR